MRRRGLRCLWHRWPAGAGRAGCVSLGAQLLGTLLGVAWALIGGFEVYGVLKVVMGLRLTAEEEYTGADLSIHKIGATPEREVSG